MVGRSRMVGREARIGIRIGDDGGEEVVPWWLRL